MRRLWSFGWMAGAALAIVACSGSDDDGLPTNPPPTPTIAIQVSPASATVSRGDNASASVSLTRGGGYTGAVQLAATGVPSGVSVVFNPASLSGSTSSATMTVSAGEEAAAGKAPSFQITASGAGVDPSSASFSLEVSAPTIALSGVPPTISAVQGGSASIPVSITRGGGFSGSVTVTASGLPAGVTASAVTIPGSSSSGTMTLDVSAAAVPGSASITLTATGDGVLQQTATSSLTITAAATPAFSILAAPAAVSLTAGSTATSNITVARSGGFSGRVTLSVEGAPDGVTASIAPTALEANETSAVLTLTSTAAAVPGNYSLSVSGSGSGVANQSAAIAVTITEAEGLSISTTTGAAEINPGGTASTGVSIVRSGGYAADVSLSVEGLPSGLSASFSPAILSGSTAAATLTLSADAALAVGDYQLRVVASGPAVGGGEVSAGTALQLSVLSPKSYTINAGTASVDQGQTASLAVTLDRSGGFDGEVTLSVSGLPTGVTASISPASSTGNSFTLELVVPASLTPGSYNGTITGSAAGIDDVVASFAFTVNSAGNGGSGGNVVWTFCNVDHYPVWFAVQNGSGAWTTVDADGSGGGGNRTYSFTVDDRGGVAYATPGLSTSGTEITVYYMDRVELQAGGTQECVNSPATQDLSGSVAGVASGGFGNSAVVWLGSGSGSSSTDGPYTLRGAPLGISDLLAVRSTLNLTSFSMIPDKAILRRNVNYTGSIPLVDFGSSEAFDPALATYTVSGLAGETDMMATSSFSTVNGSIGSFTSILMPPVVRASQALPREVSRAFAANRAGVTAFARQMGQRIPATGARLTGDEAIGIYGIPDSKLESGDMHGVMVMAYRTTPGGDISDGRITYQFNHKLADRTLTLGAQAPALSPSNTASTPYRRLGLSGAWAADYPDAVAVEYYQRTVNTNSWTINMTRNYAGSSNWDLTIPDLSAASGFQSAWGLGSGAIEFSFTQTGITSGYDLHSRPLEGTAFRAATRTGTVN